MGLFDTYGSVQLKIHRDMDVYQLGDFAQIPDGIYVGHEGVVVVLGGDFVAEFPTLTSKYGDAICPSKVLSKLSEVV